MKQMAKPARYLKAVSSSINALIDNLLYNINREEVFSHNKSEILYVIMKAQPRVVNFVNPVNQRSNKTNFIMKSVHHRGFK